MDGHAQSAMLADRRSLARFGQFRGRAAALKCFVVIVFT